MTLSRMEENDVCGQEIKGCQLLVLFRIQADRQSPETHSSCVPTGHHELS